MVNVDKSGAEQHLELSLNSFKVSPEEALQIASDAANLMDGVFVKTRGVIGNRTIENIKVVNSVAKTKAVNEELGHELYIVNYANDCGSVVISGDKRSPEILAVLEAGNLDNIDSTLLQNDKYPKPVSLYLLSLSGFQEKAINQFLQRSDSCRVLLQSEHPTPLNNYITYYSAWRKSNVVTPMVRTKWEQGYPFNEKTPINTAYGDHTLAGCGPVAVAQLFSYYKWPSNYNWSDMIINADKYTTDPSTRNDVAEIMVDVALACKAEFGGCENKHSEAGTGTVEPDIMDGIYSMGYSSAGFRPYNTGTVIAAIKAERPVLACGYGAGGHVWVIDGYQDCSRDLFVKDVDYGWTMLVETQNYSLIHCNWGWSGLGNGFFVSEAFDICHPIISDDPDNVYPPSSDDTHLGFFYTLQAVTDIRPVK